MADKYQDLGFAKLDTDRKERTGFAEVVFCQGKDDSFLTQIFKNLIKSHPSFTQVGMSNALGISRQAVQKHLSNLKKSGRLRRVGPDKGGHWEVIG